MPAVRRDPLARTLMPEALRLTEVDSHSAPLCSRIRTGSATIARGARRRSGGTSASLTLVGAAAGASKHASTSCRRRSATGLPMKSNAPARMASWAWLSVAGAAITDNGERKRLPLPELEDGWTKPHRDRDLVVRREESFPPRLTLAAAGHLGEETKALVLPRLNRVEIGRIVLDQRLDEGATVADVAGLVTNTRAVIDRRQHVAARLRAVRQHGERAGAGGTLGHEVALHENLDRVLELEQMPEEAARRPRRFPRGEPVALGDAGPLENLAVHLEMPLLVGELEQRRLLQLVEGSVGGGGRHVVRGRQLGIVVVGELIDRLMEVAGADGLVVQRIVGDGRALGEIPLALARLHDVLALPAEGRRVAEQRRVLEDEPLARHRASSIYLHASAYLRPSAAWAPALPTDRGANATRRARAPSSRAASARACSSRERTDSRSSAASGRPARGRSPDRRAACVRDRTSRTPRPRAA